MVSSYGGCPSAVVDSSGISRPDHTCMGYTEAAFRSPYGATLHGVAVPSGAALPIRLNEQRALAVMHWNACCKISNASCLNLGDERVLAVSNEGQVASLNQERPSRDWVPTKARKGEPDVGADSR